MPMGGWRYSQAHNAVLGPFGELLTEEDLLYLETQIEGLQMRRKCQEYESELERLADELQSILPAPIINITVNTQFIYQDAEQAGQASLPVWCNRISGVVNNMTLLLTNVNGKPEGGSDKVNSPVITEVPQHVPSHGQLNKSPSNSFVEKEILEFGVSVRNLRSNFEKKGQNNSYSQKPKRAPRNFRPVEDFLIQKTPEKSKIQKDQSNEDEYISDSGISSEDASFTSDSPIPPSLPTILRKERIVVLFLSHWKKSAYSISLKAKTKKTQSGLISHEAKELNGGTAGAGTKSHTPLKKSLMAGDKLAHLMRQQSVIKKLIGNWKHIISHVPKRQIRHLNRQQVTYSPEQFLPHVNGKPADYNSLTLDLFMLGYFHILELDLPNTERQMRHLLCFEVFDHLGTHGWELVRNFHKAVIDEIHTGKREWNDGFEDIKRLFFGHGKKCTSVENGERPVPKVAVQTATPEEKEPVLGGTNCNNTSTFNNDEICSYIDRSFAFWKEKEAELFDFEE